MFTHINQQGEANMVDVSNKASTARTATAACQVLVSEQLLLLLQENNIPKGDVFATARIAGIQAAKACSQLIPLCHPIALSSTQVEFLLQPEHKQLSIQATCKTNAQTGVEMEAMTAVSVAALTFYDMCKAIDKGIVIEKTQLLHKSGGKSGTWERSQQEDLADAND